MAIILPNSQSSGVDIQKTLRRGNRPIKSLAKEGKGQDENPEGFMPEDHPPVLAAGASRELRDAWFDTVIQMYLDLNVDEIASFTAHMVMVRGTRANEHAATPSKVHQWALSIPARLAAALERIYPGWWKDKREVTRFAKRYPLFAVPKKI